MKWIRSFGHSDQQLRTQWDCLPIPISIKSNPSETEAGGYIFPCKSAVVYFVASIRNDLLWTETSRGNLLETLKQRIEVTAIDMNANAIICISNNQYPQLQQDFEPQDLCALMLVSVVQDDITSTQLQDWLVKLNFFQQTYIKMSFHERVQRFSGLGLTWEGSETQILTVLENTQIRCTR